jgi:LysR family nitrogen assimilation transcriptional regulator
MKVGVVAPQPPEAPEVRPIEPILGAANIIPTITAAPRISAWRSPRNCNLAQARLPAPRQGARRLFVVTAALWCNGWRQIGHIARDMAGYPKGPANPCFRMDLRKLRYFATVAELGSFTKAAARLHVAQPALSRHVRELEAEVGLELLSRVGRHIRPTDAGHALLRHSRTIERDLERLNDDMRARKDTPTGRVILGVPPALADIVVPAVVRRIQDEYPLISISIVEGISPVLSEWVQNHEIDLAILGLACEGDKRVLPGLKVEILVAEDMVVFQKANGAANPRSYSLSILMTKQLVLSENFAAIVRSQLGTPELKLNVSLEIESVQAIKALVLAGQAATILPISMLYHELRQRRVVASSITMRGVKRQIMLAQPSFCQMTQATKAVIRIVKEEIERMDRKGMFSLKTSSSRSHPECKIVRR